MCRFPRTVPDAPTTQVAAEALKHCVCPKRDNTLPLTIAMISICSLRNCACRRNAEDTCKSIQCGQNTANRCPHSCIHGKFLLGCFFTSFCLVFWSASSPAVRSTRSFSLPLHDLHLPPKRWPSYAPKETWLQLIFSHEANPTPLRMSRSHTRPIGAGCYLPVHGSSVIGAAIASITVPIRVSMAYCSNEPV